MKSKEYLPRSEAQLTFWCDGFKVQFPAHAAELGFSESDIAAMTGACTGITAGISDVNVAKIVFEEKVSQKNKTVEINTAMIREMVRRIKYRRPIPKRSANCWESSGKAVPSIRQQRFHILH